PRHADPPNRPDPATPPPPNQPDPATPPAPTRPDPPTPKRHADQPAVQTPRPPADLPVRVQPGDSLWLIAARRLSPDATDEQIAANWPRWYAANRAAIGDDPSLIEPGQVLHAPPPSDLAR